MATDYRLPDLSVFQWQQPVIDITNTPPVTPLRGARYIVGTNPDVGDWFLKAKNIAYCSNATGPVWLFDAPKTGMHVYNKADGKVYYYNNSNAWVEQISMGPTGPTGADSTVAGPTGPTGPTGADSTVVGPTGPTGSTGPTGADSTVVGPTGPTGADSTVAGPTGPTGADSTVVGPTGPTGADSTVAGPTGPTGADSTVVGPTGPTGPTGADSTVAGPTGPTGADSTVVGPTGPTGATGATGAANVAYDNDFECVIITI